MITAGLWIIVAVLACILSGMSSGIETGIYVLNKIRLDLHASAGSKSAKRLSRLVAKPDNLLVVILIGTNIGAYIATFAISALYILFGAGQNAEWYTIATATPLLFILGESLPKNVFRRFGETLTHKCSIFLELSSVAFNWCGLAPLIRFVSRLIMMLTPAGRRTDTPLARLTARHIVAEGAASGVITHFQSVMAQRAMEIKLVAIDTAMTPMDRVVTVPVDITRDQLTGIMRTHNYSQFPVTDQTGQIVGILNIFDMLIGDTQNVMQVARKPITIDHESSVTDALYHLNTANRLMAVVTKDDNPVGIITVKDLVEEIVGELEEW